MEEGSEHELRVLRERWRPRASLGGYVLALVAALVLIGFLMERTRNAGRIVRTGCSKVRADIQAIADALSSYGIEHDGRLPAALSDLVAGQDNRYLDIDTVPLDPWGRPYGYEPPEPGGKAFRVFSLGKDGRPGGEGEDQDIDNLLIKEGKI
jgi:general secretion pathway protein G